MKICPICRKKYEAEFFFCEDDGQKLEGFKEKKEILSVGDKSIISGDINIATSSAAGVAEELDQGLGINIGDKNIISGDINVDQTTNIGNVIINKDDSKQILKCFASGRNILITDSFSCSNCKSMYHISYLDNEANKCTFCRKESSKQKEEALYAMVVERLADFVLDQEEVQEIYTFSHLHNIEDTTVEHIILKAKDHMNESRSVFGKQEEDFLVLSREYFNAYKLQEAFDTSKSLFLKHPNHDEIKRIHLISWAIIEPLAFKEYKRNQKHDDAVFYMADYFASITTKKFDQAAEALSELSSKFNEHPFSLVMKYDFALQQFLSSTENSLEQVKAGDIKLGEFLKTNIDQETYRFEFSLLKFFQGLHVFIFRMPFLAAIDQDVKISLSNLSLFGYNRFFSGEFWSGALDMQNELVKISGLKELNDNAKELLNDSALMQLFVHYTSGKFDAIQKTEAYKLEEIDDSVKSRFEVAFLSSNKIFNFEKVIPFTDVLIDSERGISVPVSMKYSLALKMIDLSSFVNNTTISGVIETKELSSELNKKTSNILITQFASVFKELNVSIGSLSSSSSQFTEMFKDIARAELLERTGTEIVSMSIQRITPDKESAGFIKLSNSNNAYSSPVSVSAGGAFHINVNNVNYGPYNFQQLSQMISTNQFAKQTMVWREGMAGWDCATNISELNQLF